MKKQISALCLALLLMFTGTACASNTTSAVEAKDMEQMEEYSSAAYNESASVEEAAGNSGAAEESKSEYFMEIPEDATQVFTNERKIIRNATLTIETKTFDESVSALKQAVEEVQGYIEYSTQYTGSGARSAELICRVSAAQYGAFLERLQETGSIVRTEESTEDATSQYVDMEARLKSLRTQEKRLSELMKNSGSLEELLAVQEELMQVQYEIENYTGQLKALSEQIDYATVHVWLDEVEILTPVEPSFTDRMKDAFVNMLVGVKDGAEFFVIALISLLPLLVVLGVILLIILISVKRRKRKAPSVPQYYPPTQPQEQGKHKQ